MLMIPASASAQTSASPQTQPEVYPMAEGPFKPDWKSLAQYQTPQWFADAKFGIWAHWGPQCQPEQGDWYAQKMYIQGHGMYKHHVAKYGHPSKFGFKDIIHLWKAEKWEPEKLIALYKRAGAKYFVAMANHHDNFDCYDSKYQPWNSTRIGPKKDIVGLWEKAARAEGMRFGVTVHAGRAWSWFEQAQGSDKTGPLAGVPYDGKLTKADGKGTWWDGLDPQDLYAQNHEIRERLSDAYCAKFYNRTIDLVEKYKPDLLYFDDHVLPVGGNSQKWGLGIAAHLYNASIKWNNGKNEAVMNTKRLNEQQRKCMVLDIERGASERIEPLPWQTDTCIGNWHYHRGVFEKHTYKKPGIVIHMLADIVSKNGNLLLNIPIRGDGTIDQDEVDCLDGIAKWMDVNSEAIYSTRPWTVFGEGPTKPGRGSYGGVSDTVVYTPEDFRFTTKSGGLYAICLSIPKGPSKIVSLAKTDKPIAAVELVGGKEKLTWKQEADGLTIQPARTWPSEHAVVFKIGFQQ
jgi:alpha-L-fucosidase